MTHEEYTAHRQRWATEWDALFAAMDALGRHAMAQQRDTDIALRDKRWRLGQLRIAVVEAEQKLRWQMEELER